MSTFRASKVRECVKLLRLFHGLPPHDVPSNICRSDGYFYAAMKKGFDYDVVEEAENIVLREVDKWEKARQAFMKGQK